MKKELGKKKTFRDYLKCSDEGYQELEREPLDGARYMVKHWDEYQRLLEKEIEFEKQDREEFWKKVKSTIFFWKKVN